MNTGRASSGATHASVEAATDLAFSNLGALFDVQALATKPALIALGDADSDGHWATDTTLSYGELDAQANAVARALLARGLQPGERVAILAANSADYIATLLGIMRAGLVGVPVNFKFPMALTHYVIHDSGAKLVFCDAPRREAVPEGVPVVEFGASGSDGLAAFVDPGPFESTDPAPDDIALFLYTSGSTGKPKGVKLTHASHLWVSHTRARAQDPSAHRFLVAAPLYHMNALSLVFMALYGGATVVLMPQFQARAYIRAIEHYGITWLTSVPPMIAMMLREADLIAATDLSSVRFIRMGSAPVSEALLERIHEVLPNARVTNVYGTTEGGPIVFGPHPQGLTPPMLSVGYPHPQVQVRLLDAPTQGAATGVLAMRSPGQMQGYHNRPDLRAPLTEDGYYITGDIFRRDDQGFHTFVGRADDMFVSGGENIFPGEVEQMLETHPEIVQACVVPVDDDIKGTKPVAYVVRKTGSTLDAQGVRQYALANAPAYQHPRQVWFVDALPLASTNKIDRSLLISMAREAVRTAES